MRFTLSSSELVNRLSLLAKNIQVKNSITIWDCFLFEVKDDMLYITSSEDSNMMRMSIDLMHSDGEGRFCIPNRSILSAIKELPEQPLTFEINRSEIKLIYQNGVYNMLGYPEEEYTTMEPISGDNITEFQLPANQFASVLQRTLFAVGNSELHTVINGVCFDLTNESLNAVGSDGHQMVHNQILACKSEKQAAFILPKKPAAMLCSAIKANDTDPITIRFNEQQVEFSFNNAFMSCCLVEGTYPNYNAVVPKNNIHKLVCERKTILSALRRVMPFSDKQTELVKLHLLTNSKVEVCTRDAAYQVSAQETFTCDYNGPEMSIGFKGTSLIDLISYLTSDIITLELSDPTRAGILRPAEQPDGEDVLMLIMPMLLSENLNH